MKWSNNISRNIKIRVSKTIAESIATYGAELWVINKKDSSKLQAMEKDYWRRRCQSVRTDRISNSEIRKSKMYLKPSNARD